MVRAGLEPVTSGFQLRRPNHSATLPLCFTIILCNFFPKEHLFVNIVGQNETRASYASKTGFLSKFTFPYYGEITVRNYLILAAFMRMSRTMDNAAKFERVEQIISEVCRGLGKMKPVHEAIDQFRYIRYIKIQPKTIDLSTRLWRMNTEFVGFIPQSAEVYCFNQNFNKSNWSIGPSARSFSWFQ